MLMAQASESKSRALGGYELPEPEVIHPNGRNYKPTADHLARHRGIREALRKVGAPLGAPPQPRAAAASSLRRTPAVHVPGFDDAAAETAEVDPAAVAAMEAAVDAGDYRVPDATATTKTRGSAAHIVPWSADETIRLDPSNGICLSPLVDRAYELGYLIINEERIVRVSYARIGGDDALTGMLAAYDGTEPPRQTLTRHTRNTFVVG
jgi:hypothetical protein